MRITTTTSRLAAIALASCIAIGTVGVAAPAWARATASTTVASLPQTRAADRAASWLASQVTASGYVTFSGDPDLSDTTLVVLALAATGKDKPVARKALDYLEAHVDAYAQIDGQDQPGALATLILDAHALGVNPARFGGTDLVTRLLATMRTSGPDVGLFGAEDPTYDGAYRQGLALAALAAAKVTSKAKVGKAITWLQGQQCADGGWESFRTETATPCTPTDPDTYTGPDTNSTALAIQGLAAQHAAMHHSPIAFYRGLEASTGGWGYFGGPADPDSTALVIQALIALHVSASATEFRKGADDPVTALLSFQLSSGAVYYPSGGPPNVANGLATEQATPALAKRAFPF